MSQRGEQTLLQHLVDPDSLDVISKEGLAPEAIPNDNARRIFLWALDYYFSSGRSAAPSVEALRAVEFDGMTFGDALDDMEVQVEEEPADTVEWALDDLRSTYVYRISQQFNRDFATEMGSVQEDERVAVVGAFASELVSLSMSMQRRTSRVDVRDGMADIVRDYDSRALHTGIRGAQFGLREIDLHTWGIHDGELAIVAAGPKTGKSYALAWAALAEWRAGRPVALFTLENSVAMTQDRIACMAAGVDSGRWQRGECMESEVEAVQDWANEISSSDTPLYVIQPDLGQRSFEHMVREAQVLDASTLIVDQLTFVELAEGNKSKTERIGDALHRLKAMISTGRSPMPCILAHQISREGVKAAHSEGHLEMYHLADSAEVERTADWVFGMYASRDDQAARRIKWQILATRRAVTMNWELEWMPELGSIRVRNTVTL